MSINDYNTGNFIRTATTAEVATYEGLSEGYATTDRCPDTGACDGALIAPDLAGMTIWVD